MKRITTAFVLVLFVAAVSWAGGPCSMWTSCPLDGAQANLVNTEYQGIVAIGVYQHVTTTGQVHKFRQRCN